MPESSRIMALDRVCQTFNPSSWAFLRLIQQIASWNTFHLVLYYTFRGFDTSWYSSSCESLMGSTAVKNTACLPSFVSFFSCNQSWVNYWVHKEGTSNVVKVLTPSVQNYYIIQQCRINLGSSSVLKKVQPFLIRTFPGVLVFVVAA